MNRVVVANSRENNKLLRHDGVEVCWVGKRKVELLVPPEPSESPVPLNPPTLKTDHGERIQYAGAVSTTKT